MSLLRPVALVLGLLLSLGAVAAIDTHQFDSEEERQRFRTLTAELRCPKCQNQNIADSDAPIANDLRAEIFRMLKEGSSNGEIVDHLVLRYGEFVRYQPPLNTATVLLWFGPALLLLGGLVMLLVIVRRRRALDVQHDDTLTPEERARLSSLLDKQDS